MTRTTRPSRLRAAGLGVAGLAIVVTSWVMGQRTGEEAVTGMLRDSIAFVAAESLQAAAPAAAMLTREDSMAIARAVSSRLTERPAPARTASRPTDQLALAAFADSIRAQIQRAVLDSLLLLQTRAAAQPKTATEISAAAVAEAAQRMADVAMPSAPPRGPRRVIVAMPRTQRNRPDLDAIAAALADSLWRALDAHPRYVAVPADSVAAVLRESRTVNTVQEKLSAALIISISLVPARDSIVRLVQIRDLSAPGAFAMRVVSHTAPAADPTAGVGKLASETMRALAEMERGARNFARQPAPAPPAPPTRPR